SLLERERLENLFGVEALATLVGNGERGKKIRLRRRDEKPRVVGRLVALDDGSGELDARGGEPAAQRGAEELRPIVDRERPGPAEIPRRNDAGHLDDARSRWTRHRDADVPRLADGARASDRLHEIRVGIDRNEGRRTR